MISRFLMHGTLLSILALVVSAHYDHLGTDQKLEATISSEVLHDLLEGESLRQGGDQ